MIGGKSQQLVLLQSKDACYACYTLTITAKLLYIPRKLKHVTTPTKGISASDDLTLSREDTRRHYPILPPTTIPPSDGNWTSDTRNTAQTMPWIILRFLNIRAVNYCKYTFAAALHNLQQGCYQFLASTENFWQVLKFSIEKRQLLRNFKNLQDKSRLIRTNICRKF